MDRKRRYEEEQIGMLKVHLANRLFYRFNSDPFFI